MRILQIFIILFFIPKQVTFGIDVSATIMSGGVSRSFLIHAKGTAIAKNLPVVFVLHGDGGTGAGIKSYSGFDLASESFNYLAVYPNSNQAGGLWNKFADNTPGDAGTGNTTAVDDVIFFSDLIDYLCTTYEINRGQVYATGHSGGAFMSYNLAVQLPNKIAAIAPVAGSLWGSNPWFMNYFQAANFVPIPVYHIHGDADNTVAYPDPNHVPNAWNEWPLNQFGYFDCGTTSYTTTTNLNTAGTVKELSFCSSAKKVSLIRMVGGGHGWPSAAGYNAATAISTFFLANSIPNQASCANVALALTNIRISGKFNPITNQINFECLLTDTNGIDIYDFEKYSADNNRWQKLNSNLTAYDLSTFLNSFVYQTTKNEKEYYFRIIDSKTKKTIASIFVKAENAYQNYIYYEAETGHPLFVAPQKGTLILIDNLGKQTFFEKNAQIIDLKTLNKNTGIYQLIFQDENANEFYFKVLFK
jgi:poly(3-hydroxybutyrate) depolymerase